MEPGDVSVERAELLEGAGAVRALVLVLVLNIVHPTNVSPEVPSLGELHGAEAAGVRLLSRVLQTVTLQTLFLSEGLPALLALVRSDSRVYPLVSRHLGRFEELLTAVLAAQLISIPGHHLRPLPDQLQTRLQLLVSQLMLFKLFGGGALFTTGLTLQGALFRVGGCQLGGGIWEHCQQVFSLLGKLTVQLEVRAHLGMFQLEMLLQHLLRGELVPTLGAEEVVLLLVHGEMALEAGQASEALSTLRALQPLPRLVARPVQPHVLLEVVRGSTVLAPELLVLLVTPHMFPASCPAVELLSTHVTGVWTRSTRLLKLHLVLLGSVGPPLHVSRGLVSVDIVDDRGEVGLGTGLLYPEDLAIVEGEEGTGGELDVGGQSDRLVLVHHQLLRLHRRV